MKKPTWDEFLFHYGCEWDTGEFLGWDELKICMEQLGMLSPDPEPLRGLTITVPHIHR